jgi:hypothetical protein
MPDTEVIQRSATFRGLAAKHANIEVWHDQGIAEGGYAYFWIVSNVDGTVRNLAYVRCKPGEFQRRTYHESGDDRWVDAE